MENDPLLLLDDLAEGVIPVLDKNGRKVGDDRPQVPQDVDPSEDPLLLLDSLAEGDVPELHGPMLKKHLDTMAALDARKYQQDQDLDAQTEREFRFKDKGWIGRNVGMALGAGGQRIVAGAGRISAAITGDEEDSLVADQLNREANITSEARNELRKKNNEGYLAKFVGNAAESVPAMLTAARYGAAGIVAIPAAMQASESFTEAKDAGLSKAAAKKYALTQGFIEGAITGIFQKIGGGKFSGVEGVILGKGAGGSTLKEFSKNLLKNYGSEWTEEQLIGLGQAAEKVASGVDPHALDWDRLQDQMIDISGTTAVMTGAAQGARRIADGSPASPINQEAVNRGLAWAKANPDAAAAMMKTGKLSRRDAEAIGAGRTNAADREAMLTAIERSTSAAMTDEVNTAIQGDEALADQYRGEAATLEANEAKRAAQYERTPEYSNQQKRRATLEVPSEPEQSSSMDRVFALKEKLGRMPNKNEISQELQISREDAGFLMRKTLEEQWKPHRPTTDQLPGNAVEAEVIPLSQAAELDQSTRAKIVDEFEVEQQERIALRAKGDRRATVVNLHPVTEMHEGKYANRRFVEIALKRHSDKTPVVYVEGDLHNLGGLNTKKGQTVADKHFKAMAAIAQEEIDALNADSALTTKGGDEFGFTIVGKSKAEVDAALAKAKARIVEYVKAEGLDQLPHGKDLAGTLGLQKGTGINFASAQFDPDAHADASELIKSADEYLEKVKKEGAGNVDRKQTGAIGPASPEGQARRAEGRVGATRAGTEREGGSKPKAPSREQEDLNSLAPAELRDRAKALGIKQIGGLRKKVIIQRIREAQTSNDPEISALNESDASHVDHEATLEQGDGDTISNQEIIAKAARAFGVPVRSGYVSIAKAMGVYHNFEEIVKLRGQHSGNLYVATHEIAHHIDNTLKLTTKGLSEQAKDELRKFDYEPLLRRPNEGFAEYIARELDGEDMAAQAPTFAKEFRQRLTMRQDLKKNLEAFKADVEGWRNASAMSRANATLSQTGVTDFRTAGEKVRDFGRKVKSALLDRNGIAKVFVNEINERREKEGLGKLPENQDPAAVMEAIGSSAHANAAHALKHGVYNPVTGQSYNVRGMVEIMAPFNEEQWNEIVQFARARHSLEWIADSRNPGMAKADAEAIVKQFGSKPEYVKAADEWVAYNKALLDLRADTGAITKEFREAIDKYPHYVPLQRAFDVSELAQAKLPFGSAKPMHKATKTGSGRQVVDPLTSTIKQTYDVYKETVENFVYRKYIDAAKGVPGSGKWISEYKLPVPSAIEQVNQIKAQLEAMGVDSNDTDLTSMLTSWNAGRAGRVDGLIPIVIDGEAKWFQVHPDLQHVVSSLSRPQNELLGPLAEGVMRPFTELKRFGAVEGRPGFFGGSNPIRDLATGIIQTRGNSAKFALRTIGNMLIVGKSADVQKLYQRSGAATSHFFGGSLESMKAQVSDVVNDAKKREQHNVVLSGAELIARMLKSPIKSIKAIAEHFEQAPRLAEFEGQLNAQGITRKHLAAGRAPALEDTLSATLAAKRVTTNFEQAGSVVQKWNRVNAFFNATVQGMYQPIQRFKENPERFALRGVAWLTVPSILLWLKNRDKDWYKELQPWERFGFWHLDLGDGKPIKVPMPFEIGRLFGALPVAILDDVTSKDPKRAQQFAEQMLPNQYSLIDLTPDAFQPALEAAFNYDVFRRKKIVGAQLERKKPEDQYSDYNTAFSKYVGQSFGWSPAKIDHMLSGYTGGLLTDVLKVPEEGPVKALALKRFSTNTSRGESINEFYERDRQLDQEYNSAGGAKSAPAKLKSEKNRFDHIQSLMAAVNDAARVETDSTKRAEIQKFNVGLSRLALGKEPLKDYPSLFTAKTLPAALQDARNDYLISRARAISAPLPLEAAKGKSWAETRADYEENWNRAATELEALGIDSGDVLEIYREHVQSEYKTDATRRARLNLLKRRLQIVE